MPDIPVSKSNNSGTGIFWTFVRATGAQQCLCGVAVEPLFGSLLTFFQLGE